MTTNFLNKKTLITLDSDSTFPEKVSNYIFHSTRFSEILPELIKESNQKIASRHLKATFVETGGLCDYDPLLRWRNLEVNRLFGLFSASDNRVALSKFNQLEEKFTEKPDIVGLKNEILNESTDVRKSLLISKQYWGKIETHGFYDEMITRFAKLFANLSMTELSFISYFISMDESGALFLFHKFIYTCLKCKLASQLIVALYKPGAFIAFFDKVVKLLW
jgi:hypothetical protein